MVKIRVRLIHSTIIPRNNYNKNNIITMMSMIRTIIMVIPTIMEKRSIKNFQFKYNELIQIEAIKVDLSRRGIIANQCCRNLIYLCN